MGNDFTPMNIVSDLGSFMTLGIVDIKKGRVNVPFSGAAMEDFFRGTANLYTFEQLRDKTADFFSSPIMKGVATVAGVVAGVAVGAGVAGALSGAGTVASSAGAAEAAGTGVAAADTAAAPLAIASAGEVASGGIPVATGAAEAATGADIAGATLAGRVGATAAPEVASSAPGGLANMVGAGAGEGVGGAPLTGFTAKAAASPFASFGSDAAAMQELGNAAPRLASMPTQSWWSSLSPGAQMALVTGGLTAAQMGTGAMQGMFAGASAKQKLELEQLINSQYQAQIQYKNRNNQYAPLLTFKQPGLANTIGAPNAGA